MDSSIRQAALASDLAKVLQARAITPEMKFRAGGELFEDACRWKPAGIASQFPQMGERERRAELRRRLALAPTAHECHRRTAEPNKRNQRL